MKRLLLCAVFTITALLPEKAHACTGITLRTAGGTPVPARTIEWAGNDLESKYTIVPRGFKQHSLLPDGQPNGMEFVSRYGYVGLAVQEKEFVVEGLNEAGLSAGLFYFPAYGKYVEYHEELKANTISDLQLVSWILGSFKTIDEVKFAMTDVRVVTIDPRGSTVHWRITEESGRQAVLEIINGKPKWYENQLGVLTNSPSFDWHLTNLNNYVNLSAGPISQRKVGNMTLTAFGGGGGLHGIPGDMTPPSRFVRAAFFQTTAPQQATAEKTVTQAFHILNNFDIPTGIQFEEGQEIPDIPSATQWTVVSDIANRRIYYRTMHNSNIRCFDLKSIDFKKVKYQWGMLDKEKKQPIEMVVIK